MIFDFHAHPSFKPYNSRSIYDEDGQLPDDELWKERFRPKKYTTGLPKLLEGEVNYTSQIHLNALYASSIRGMCVSLYPLERVFTVGFKDLSESVFFRIIAALPGVNAILNYKKRRGKKLFLKMIATLTGYDPEVINKLHYGGYNYYSQLVGEYDFIIKNQNKAGGHKKIAYEVANNFTEYNRIINEGKIAYIMSVEGTNVFMGDSKDFDQLVKEDMDGDSSNATKTIEGNLADFMSKQFAPFIVTFAHHQYNFLCGHAPSFIGVAKAALNQEGSTPDPDHPNELIHYFCLGLKEDSKRIIKNLLLGSYSGKKVLIDTKHMSAKARHEYHQLLQTDPALKNKNIPIIQTHTGVNGRKKLSDAFTLDSVELSKSAAKQIPFFTGSINLFDDEIIDIVKSKGLIGIMLDEKRIVGEKLHDDTKFFSENLPPKVWLSTDDPNYVALNRAEKRPENRYKYNKEEFKIAINKMVKAKRKLAVAIQDGEPEKKLRRLTRRLEEKRGRVETLRQLLEFPFLTLLANQFIYIVKTYKEARINDNSLPDINPWNHLCIGSDYEGVINPLDLYFYADDLVRLQGSLEILFINAINNPYPAFDKYREVMEIAEINDIVRNLLWNNSQWFLKKHFV